MKKYVVLVLAVMLLSVMISSCYASTITVQGRIPEGKVGQSYSASFSATSTASSHIRNWDFRGTIPGLTFSGYGYSGTLSGTPSQNGNFSCSIIVTDNNGNKSDPYQFTVRIHPRNYDGGGGDDSGDNTGGELSIGGYLTADNVGTKYPENNYGELIGKATAEGGTPPYTWSVIDGDLPKGLCLAGSSAEGFGYKDNRLTGSYVVLSGIAALEGTYKFTLKVTDSTGISATEDFSVKVKGGDFDEIKAGGDFPDGVARWTGNFGLYKEEGAYVESGGRAPYTWTQIGGELPDGITLSTKNNKAMLSGTPSKSGEYRFVLKVTDADGRTAKKAYSLRLFKSAYQDLTVYGSYTDNEPIPEISGSLMAATAGKSYSDSVTASGGTAPYTWSVSYGELPEGVYLSGNTVTGTPKAEGFYNFTLKVTDANGRTNAKIFVLKVTEEEKIPPEIKTETLTNAITGQTYSYQLTASGTAPITWTKSGTLPKGLTLNSSGLISGTPTKAGKSSFTVTAKNSYGKASRKFTINVLEPVSITTASLKAGTITKSYSVTLKAKGSKTITWSAEGLPNGLTMNEKGKISGKPTVYGNFTVKITAGNEAGSVVKTLPLEIKAIAPKLSGTLAKPSLNEPYSSALKVTGSEPVTWSITGTLPDGLTFDTSTGKISGTPTTYTKSGWKITITATNDAGKNSKNITLKVNATAPKITAKLPGATAGENYSAKLTATGSEAITFTADLPEYLTLDGNVIAGNIPESIKSFKIKVYASNPVKTVSKTYTIRVSKKKKATREILKAENDTDIMENDTGINTEVIADMPVNSEIDADNNSGYVAVVELGEVSCDLPGMYDFNVELPDHIEEGSELVYFANSDNPSEDDSIAEFYDDAGNEISVVPENRRITISIWLNPETIYNPVIAVKY